MNKNHKLVTQQNTDSKSHFDLKDFFGRNILVITVTITIMAALVWFFGFSGDGYRLTEYGTNLVKNVTSQIGMGETFAGTSEEDGTNNAESELPNGDMAALDAGIMDNSENGSSVSKFDTVGPVTDASGVYDMEKDASGADSQGANSQGADGQGAYSQGADGQETDGLSTDNDESSESTENSSIQAKTASSDSADSSAASSVSTVDNTQPYVPYIRYTPEKTDSRYYRDVGVTPQTMVADYTTVDDSYFADSCWIGDSRCMGINDYAAFEGADFYCDNGYCAYDYKLGKAVKHQGTGEKCTLEEAMSKKTYGKVYLMLGINDCGYGNTQTFKEDYKSMIDVIRKAQPEAVIYLVGNMHITREAEKTSNPGVFTNKNINAKNVAIAGCADGINTFYLDFNYLYTDDDGYLKDELTFDGFHLYAAGYMDAIQFFRDHAIER